MGRYIQMRLFIDFGGVGHVAAVMKPHCMHQENAQGREIQDDQLGMCLEQILGS